MPPPSANKAEPTLALKPRGDVTRSPKQGYQWPHKWTCVQQKIFKKNNKKKQQNKYLSLLPPHCVTRSLHLQPKKKFDNKVWYLDLGVNTLCNTMKELYKKAGIPGF